MGHIGDQPGDHGHGVGLLERPVDDPHHPVVILREPVVAGLKLLDGHFLRPHDHRAPRVLRVIGADDPPLHLKFPVELGTRIRDEDVDGDAVDPHLFQGLDGPVEHIRHVGVEPEDDTPVHQDAMIVEPRDVLPEPLDPVEPLIRLGKGGSGHGLHPNEDSEATRLCGQGEQLLAFCKKHMGLHKELDLVPFGSGRRHRRERKGHDL